jgi:hypothetical protein
MGGPQFGQPGLGQQYGQQQGIQGPLGLVGAQVVSDTVLRVVSVALSTVLEQLRIDPVAQQSLCAQGQLTPQAFSNVITESARRSAPTVAQAFAHIAQSLQQQIGQQQPGQMAGIGQQQPGQMAGIGQQQPGQMAGMTW